MNLNIASTIIACGLIPILKRHSGSRAKADEYSVNILDNDAYVKAVLAMKSRIEELKSYKVVSPGKSFSGPAATTTGFHMKEWMILNPKIIFASDLLHVKKSNNDKLGKDILRSWMSLPKKDTFIDGIESPIPIMDSAYPYNMLVSEIDPQFVFHGRPDKRSGAKSAPVGKISFLEFYNVPYKIELNNVSPIGLWRDG